MVVASVVTGVTGAPVQIHVELVTHTEVDDALVRDAVLRDRANTAQETMDVRLSMPI